MQLKGSFSFAARTAAVVLAALLLALGPTACDKGRGGAAPVGEGTAGPPAAAAADEGGGAGPAEVADSTPPVVAEAVVLSDSAALCDIVDGAATRTAALRFGDRLTLVSEASGAERAAISGETRDGEFLRYRNEAGREGWVETAKVGRGHLAAALGARVPLYSEPKTAKPTGDFIAGATLLAAFTDGVAGGFAFVTAPGPAGGEARTGFVRAEDLSDKKPDLAVAALLAEAAGDPAKAGDFYEKAKRDYPASAFDALVEAGLAKTRGVEGSAEAGQKASGTYEVVENNVNVRDSPDAVFGAVVGTLSAGERVEAVALSSETAVVDGRSAKWVKIAKPGGWVFGASLKAAK